MVTSTSQRLLEPIPSIIKKKLPFKLLMLGEWSKYKTIYTYLKSFVEGVWFTQIWQIIS